jgi:hypothetical protein
MRSRSSKRPTVEILDLVEVICDHRKEAFPFEKYAALMTFSTWLRAPNNPDMIGNPQVVGAALIIRAIRGGTLKVPGNKRTEYIDSIAETLLPPEIVADALIKRATPGSFRDYFGATAPRLSWVGAIVAFLLRCPTKERPSLNKAWFFIDEKGFSSVNQPENSRVPKTYLKDAWTTLAVCAPFVYAAEDGEVSSLLDLAPDDDQTITKISELINHKTDFKLYFGYVQYIQTVLLTRFDWKTLEWLTFVDFPSWIEPFVQVFEPLEADQIAILNGYLPPI